MEPAGTRRPQSVPGETAFVAVEPAFVAPATVEEAVGVLADPEAVALAGGTSVGMLVGQRLIEPSVLVWLRQVPELQGISRRGERIVIGACVTLRELLADTHVAAAFPAVTSAAAAVGNTRIRAVATVGGALAHADPRQDLPPALLAHDAEVELASGRGRRWVPLSELATGFMSTVLDPGELITAVSMPAVAGRRSSYHRYAPGSSDDYPTVSVAATVTIVRGTITSARVAVGGAGPTAYLVPEAASLVGTEASLSARAVVARAAVERSSPTDDRLGSAAYKRAVLPVWVGRALASCLAEPSPAG
jgi:carbon-monoxide dehydrogenase medium subunit